MHDVNEDWNLVLGEKTSTVEVSGDIPEKGSKMAIQNGQGVPMETEISMNIYIVTIDDKESAKGLLYYVKQHHRQYSNYGLVAEY